MGLFDKFKKDNAAKQAAKTIQPVVKVSGDGPEGLFMNRLSELQRHMISVCNAYAKGCADKIYIHGYLNVSSFSAKCLYEVKGKLVRPEKLDEVVKGKFDEETPLRTLIHDFMEIWQVLKAANQKIPFEIKMIYDAKKGSLDGKWNYPPLPKGVHEDIAPQALGELWFEELGDETKTMLNLLRQDGELGPAGPDTTTPSPETAPEAASGAGADASSSAGAGTAAEAPDDGAPLEYETFAEYFDEALEGDIPDNVIAVSFNLYDDPGTKWSVEVVGTSAFDAEDSDWACEEVADFNTRSNPLAWNENAEADDILAEAAGLVRTYLESGKHADKLKALQGVGVGFVDGDLELL